MNVITRKIQIFINEENYKEVYETLYNWQEIVFRGANIISSHLYYQENLSQFFYFKDGVSLNLSTKINKAGNEGVLKTSRQNTTYQVLSSLYKGKIPSSILASLNQNVSQTFRSERKEYFAGTRSLRNYKRNIPIPFGAKDLRNWEMDDDNHNFTFDLFQMNFKTHFGRDLSNNKSIVDRCLTGKYKILGSSISMQKKKIFLLLTVGFESEELSLKKDKQANIKLSLNYPMIVNIGKKTFQIGTKQEFLHRRLSIQRSRQELQKALKYTQGGKGRKKKLQKLKDFEKIEKNYIDTKLHTYSRELINLCIKHNCGKIVLLNQSDELKSLEEKIKEIQENDTLSYSDKKAQIDNFKFVLANWSWYGFLEKIKYKAKIYGIELVINK